MDVTENGFAMLARVLLRTAREVSDDRVVAVLEGGYDLEGLTRSIDAVLSEMRGEQLGETISPPVGDRPDLRMPLEIARHYWGI
jgi:acetoin utilization deacetylase AcuC-like enzyme